ncbi:alpha/beta fold hydrolase [Herbiconiux ginsengi]|uniref:Pimeloyl-ACP methyl ester carboxylesterase n=1 Tax=Herbiconiux ginsengi TaxID=381665 RepID=A0A1H3U0N3_9MICO|nr:alpha/beta hydrolase [Herbiconiux ginsengi]SDZ55621.1 Pimeloyl-ACP methyl ester carboxylesterase [Herbiconiux ginsengi]
MATYISETIEAEYIDGAQARYGYRQFGPRRGVPLLLLHRYRGTLDDWDPKLLDLLSADRHVIAFDNVGIGYSTGEAPDNVAAMADGVADFLGSTGLEEVDVLGWSMGGFVAQMVALNYPTLVRRLVVAGSGPGEPSIRPPENPRSLEIRPKVAPTLEETLFLFYPDDDEGRRVGREATGRFYHHQSGEVKTTKESSWRNQAIAIDAWNAGENSAWNRLETLTQPTFVANGSDDIMEDSVQSFEMVRKLPNSITTLFSRSGHAFLFQYPELFANLTLQFLEEDSLFA